jgi:hypothetical protein
LWACVLSCRNGWNIVEEERLAMKESVKAGVQGNHSLSNLIVSKPFPVGPPEAKRRCRLPGSANVAIPFDALAVTRFVGQFPADSRIIFMLITMITRWRSDLRRAAW